MHMLHRMSVWGLLVGWLILAFAAKTLRGDAAGIWVLLNPIMVIGMALLLISSIGVCLATFSSRTTVTLRQQPEQDHKNHTA
jgi:hypothetical protein